MRPWFFIHIMKCAGTAFRWTLEKNTDGAVYPTKSDLEANPKSGQYLDNREFLRLCSWHDTTLRDKRFIFGHYPFIIADFLPFDVRTAVMLRDPIQRSISMINHRRRHSSAKFGYRSDMQMLDDEDFVHRQIRNYQAKVFAIDKVNISPNDPFEVNDDGFGRACERLCSIDFIGLTEQMKETTELFNRRAGIDLPVNVPEYNAGHYDRSPPTDAFLDRLHAELRYDIRLYRLAQSQFRKQILADERRQSSEVFNPATA